MIFRLLYSMTYIFSLIGLSQQVDIRIARTFIINGEAESFIAATCLDIPAGVCCKPPWNYPAATTKVSFRHLRVWDTAAVWGDNHRATDRGVNSSPTRARGCLGLLLASRPGPGEWLWRQPATDRRPAEGASYISLPQTLPPKPEISRWLAWQGLLVLVWSGGGRWFAGAEAERLIRSDSSISVGPKRRRGVLSANRGTVVARPPLIERFPSFLEVNGTQYLKHDAGQGDEFLYENLGGEVLNLKAWFVK